MITFRVVKPSLIMDNTLYQIDISRITLSSIVIAALATIGFWTMFQIELTR